MADIDIERRSGSKWWLWLLGLLLLALLAWALIEWLDDDEAEVAAVVDPAPVAPVAPVVDPAAAAPAAMPAAISTYLSQCTEIQGAEPADMGMEHQFTVNCLQQLRVALSSMIAGQQVPNTDVSGQLDRYSSAVQQLQASEPSSTQHANLTRAAAERAAEVIQGMQSAWYGSDSPVQGAASAVQQAAQGIQPTTPMLEQRDSVRNFFRDAGNALRLMAERGAGAAATI